MTHSQKLRLYQALENPKLNPLDIGINLFLLLVLFVNITVNIVQIFYGVNQAWLSTVETLTVNIFFIELLIRFYVASAQSRFQGVRGRLRFLTQKYTLVDVLALLPSLLTLLNVNFPLIRLIRFLVFLRLLRIFRLKKIIRKFISFEAFATSNIGTKVLVLIIFSMVFVYLFKYAYSQNPLNTSLTIFLDPPSLVNAPNGFERGVGVIELMIGLFISGTLISIITSLLLDITHKVHKGLIPYRGKGHLIVMNNSPKLRYILDEIELFY